jgi:hypothetical protein
MALVPAGPARRRAAVSALARGAAMLANPDLRNAVINTGRRARAMYNDWVAPGRSEQPRSRITKAKQAGKSPHPKNKTSRNNNRSRGENAQSITNPAITTHRGAGSKPYHTGFCREKIKDINGSTSTFQVSTELVINAANSVMFPLGSQLAHLHEQYEFKKGFIRLCYETTSYTAVTGSTTAGVVVMGTNVDTADAAPTSISEAENQYGMSRCPPYATRCVHNVPLSHLPLKTLYNHFSNNALAPSGQTQASKFYDVGIFRLCVANQPNNSVIGELWVEYDITLLRRKAPVSAIGSTYVHLTESPNNSCTAAAPGGTAGYTTYVGTTGTINVTAGTNYVTMNQVGRYVLTKSTVAGLMTAGPTLTLGVDLPQVLRFQDNSASYVVVFQSGSNRALESVCFEVLTLNGPASSRTITFGGQDSMTTGKSDIFIHAITDGVNMPDHSLAVSRPMKPIPIELDEASARLLKTEQRIVAMAQALEARASQLAARNAELEEKSDADSWTHPTPLPTSQTIPKTGYFFPK